MRRNVPQFLLLLLVFISLMYGFTERRKEVVLINLVCMWIMIVCVLIYIKMV